MVIRSEATRSMTGTTSNTAWGTMVAPAQHAGQQTRFQPSRVEEGVHHEVAITSP